MSVRVLVLAEYQNTYFTIKVSIFMYVLVLTTSKECLRLRLKLDLGIGEFQGGSVGMVRVSVTHIH